MTIITITSTITTITTMKQAMDENGDGSVSFDEWLRFSLAEIISKVLIILIVVITFTIITFTNIPTIISMTMMISTITLYLNTWILLQVVNA